MSKKLICLFSVLVLSLVCTTNADVIVLGDFEDGSFDGWTSPGTATIGTVGATTGSACVDVTGGGYWGLAWEGPYLLDLTTATTLSFDVTMRVSDFPDGTWTNPGQAIAINSDLGWMEFSPSERIDRNTGEPYAGTDWGTWSGDQDLTIVYDLTGADWTGILSSSFLSISIALNNSAADYEGIFHVDNICIDGATIVEFPVPELAVTNGDFEADGDVGAIDDVNDWCDASTGSYWESAWVTNFDGVTPNGTNVVVFCSWNTAEGDPLTGSYLYQSIGTLVDQTELTVSFDWGHPDDTAEGRIDGLTVSVLASDGSFAADDANDVLNAEGVTLLDYASYDHVAEGTDGEMFPVEVTLDLSGANAGDEIFLRFNNYLPNADADPWPVLDNVQIISPAGPKIVWVTETADRDEDGVQDDQEWIDKITDAGYDLVVQPDRYLTMGDEKDPNDANDYVAELNAADVVIISRTASSGGYNNDANEIAAWASVTAPMISLSAYHVRSSRLQWIDSTTVNRSLDTYILSLDEQHAVFEDVTLEDGLVEMLFTEGFAEGYMGNCVIGSTDAGNGTIIAQTFSDEIVIAEWPADMAGYEGADVVQAGPRLLFCAGTQDTAGAVGQGEWNLADAGEQMFFNAIEYMIAD